MACILIGSLSAPVMAQSNATDTGNQTNESSIMLVSSSVVLEDYEFNSDNVTITLNAEYSQNIKIVDSYGGTAGTGAQRIKAKNVLLDNGQNTITMDVTNFKGIRGISISTGGGGVVITDRVDSGPAFTSTFSASNVIFLLIIGIVSGVGVVLITAYVYEIRISSKIRREL